MTSYYIEMIDFSIQKIDHLNELLEKSNFKPLRYLNKELGSDLTGFWVSSINNIINNSPSVGYFAKQNGKIVGILIYSINPWESDVLGSKAAMINTFVVDHSISNRLGVALYILETAINKAKSQDIQFIQCKTYTNDVTTIHALELHGFLLVDTVVDCNFDYRKVSLTNIVQPLIYEGITIRRATSADRDQLVYVAGNSFLDHFGRFHSDDNIGKKLATHVYEQWILSSLDGYADRIHIAEIDKNIVGFSIWKFPSQLENKLKVRVGHYSIAGILPKYHKHGLFTVLTYEGMKSLQGYADIIEGPTHINNYGVQKGYLKLGWRIVCDARHTFHNWLTND